MEELEVHSTRGKKSIEKATTYCMISTILHSGKGKSVETIKTSVVAGD